MSAEGRLTLILLFISALGLPTLGLMVRGAMKWTRTEDKLSQVARDIEQLVKDKDQVHREIVQQMHEDRKAMNERLTWLERNAWGKSAAGRDGG